MKTHYSTLLVLALVMLSACTITGNTTADTLRVGVINPTTGAFGEYGQEINRGIALATQEEQFQNVQVYYEDACLPNEAQSAMNALTNVHNVHAITGVYCAISMEPILAGAQQHNITAFMAVGFSDDQRSRSDLLYTTYLSVQAEAQEQAKLAKALGAKRAAILYINTAWGSSYETHFTETLTALGGEVVLSEALDIYGVDARTTLTKIRAANPDVLLIVHVGTELTQLLKQQAELGVTIPTILPYEAQTTELLKHPDKLAEGAYMVAANQEHNTQAVRFTQRYKDAYGTVPSLYAKTAYDAFIIQVRAHQTCDGNTACMREFILGNEFSGASGVFRIKPDGSADKQTTIYNIVNGTLEEVRT